MIVLRMHFRDPGEFGFNDPLDGVKVLEASNTVDVAGLPHGCASGKPSIMFRFTLPDGRIALAETTLALFLSCADAMKARFGDPR